jgi:hypothetical protein
MTSSGNWYRLWQMVTGSSHRWASIILIVLLCGSLRGQQAGKVVENAGTKAIGKQIIEDGTSAQEVFHVESKGGTPILRDKGSPGISTITNPLPPIDPLAQPEVFVEIGELMLKDKNYQEAHRVLMMVAPLGNAKAQFYVANIFRSGLGVATNDVEAAKWYLRAVRRGYLPAFSQLANMYRHGQGIGKSPSEAARIS